MLFLLGFLMYVLAALPILIENKGLFFYYGDYNVQQVPFYILAHRAVRNGNLFWNWNLDLGGTLIGDLSFYLMGSPFFWITIPFPEKAVPYMMPFLMALKYATASVTAYAYLKRFTRRRASAVTGALLYAFSGFNACNIVFNHFTDAVAFFPLFLMAFDDLMLAPALSGNGEEEGTARNGRRSKPLSRSFLCFALMTALMSVINYYFFFGQVLFLILYGCVRFLPGADAALIRRRIVRGLLGGVIGVLLAAVFLLLALGGLSGNSRLDDVLLGYDMILYPSAKLYADLLKSMVMIPDIIGKGTIFYTDMVKNASLAVYLPVFGMAGVFAFWFSRGRSWKKKLLTICLILAVFPLGNAMFSLFNEEYYARWFYMPILFMVVMTVQMLEAEDDAPLKKGSAITILLFFLMVVVAMLPARNDAGEIVFFSLIENKQLFWKAVIGTSILSIMLVFLVFVIQERSIRILAAVPVTVFGCVLATSVVLSNGNSLISHFGMEKWKEQMLDTRPELDTASFGRMESDSTATNYEMVWGIPTTHCFLSTVPSEIFDFYHGTAAIRRTVESTMPFDRIGLRAILSVKYYLENATINRDGEFANGGGIDGYMREYSGHSDGQGEQNGFAIYRNRNFIPMGFTFRYYVRESVWDEIHHKSADRHLVDVLILPDAEVDRLQDELNVSMTEYPIDYVNDDVSLEEFAKKCGERSLTSCSSFETTSSGFHAVTSDLQKDSFVFFSVPNIQGFHALVDGQKAELITADYGMMAVKVPAGVHEVSVSYRPVMLVPGLLLSLAGLALLITWFLYFRKQENMIK